MTGQQVRKAAADVRTWETLYVLAADKLEESRRVLLDSEIEFAVERRNLGLLRELWDEEFRDGVENEIADELAPQYPDQVIEHLDEDGEVMCWSYTEELEQKIDQRVDAAFQTFLSEVLTS